MTDRHPVLAALLAAALAPVALARRLARPALRLGLRLAYLGAAALVTLWLLLPDPRRRLRTDQGGPLVLTDRHGTVLYQAPGASGRPGRESWVSLDQINPVAVMTVLASEDKAFFGHAGVDPLAVGRAALLNVQGRRVGYGASTLTMQLVRLSHWPEAPRTLPRKLAEVALALKLDRTMGKREILEQYLNRAYYGHGAHGIEAAARRYLGRSAATLSAGEAAFLAVLPRGPRYYDPIKHPGRALARRDHVFDLLVKRGYLTRAEADRARAQPLAVKLHAPPHRAPHLVAHVLDELPAWIKASGGVVRTSLDLPLQERLQALTAAHVAGLVRKGVTDAAVLVLDTQTGEVRAMVGSQDFRAAGGQVNHLTSRRHLGSALKPFVYAAALARGDHPGSLADDQNRPGSGYYLVQPTQKERGAVRFREALAGSYNLAAAHLLERLGVEDVLTLLRAAGLGPLQGTARDYGVQLALGSPRLRLYDLAAAYAGLARGGRVVAPRTWLDVRSSDGSVHAPGLPDESRVVPATVAWQVLDILADPEARRPAFGAELPVDLPFPVAIKTGTARGFASTVALGVTAEYTVAVWAGNADGRPTAGLPAMRAAAPLLRDALLAVAGGRSLGLPPPPAGLVETEVCALTGLLPSAGCSHRKLERLTATQRPAATCNGHAALEFARR